MRKLTFKAILLAPFFASYSYAQNVDTHLQTLPEKTRSLAVNSALIANESFLGRSKFEFDLFSTAANSGHGSGKIWFSLESGLASKISSGKYSYSKKNVNVRKAFDFYGSFIENGTETKISDGSFNLQVFENRLSVNYDLLLANGEKLKGTYNGSYATADWRPGKKGN